MSTSTLNDTTIDEINIATSSNSAYKTIVVDGLWVKNPALVQLLGLCPLLAVSGSVVNSLGLGIATLFVFMGSNISVSLIRNQVNDTIRLPVFVMLIASFTTCAELLMNAYTYELYQILGIFIPLIVTNCAILGRAEAFASKNTVFASAIDGLMMGLGFLIVLVLLGAMREALGNGTLFADMHLLLGSYGEAMTITLFYSQQTFLLAILPPGAFILTGLLIAIKNVIDDKIEKRQNTNKQPIITGSKRVRTTGIIN